jgi:hypothetical protein
VDRQHFKLILECLLMTNDLLGAALAYAARGWPCFPIRPDAKAPLTLHGVDDATTDQAVIRRWWSLRPNANIAVATGHPAIDVLDVDVRPPGNGYTALERLRIAGLLEGATAMVRIPSGGLHLHYPGTDQRSGRLRRVFLDFKAARGYVLLPPSTVEGRSYRYLDQRADGHPLDWSAVVALLEPKPVPPPRRRKAGDRTARNLVRYLPRWVGQQAEGNRNDALFWAACTALEAGCGDDALGQLVAAAIQTGRPEAEAQRTITSAWQRVVDR